MATANKQPLYIGEVLAIGGTVSVANTGRDGTGTIVAIAAAPANGAGGVVERIRAKANGTTSAAGMLRFFYYTGSVYRLLKEIPVAAITPSASLQAWSTQGDSASPPLFPAAPGADVNGDLVVNWQMAPGSTIYASTEKADSISVSGEGGLF